MYCLPPVLAEEMLMINDLKWVLYNGRRYEKKRIAVGALNSGDTVVPAVAGKKIAVLSVTPCPTATTKTFGFKSGSSTVIFSEIYLTGVDDNMLHANGEILMMTASGEALTMYSATAAGNLIGCHTIYFEAD